MSGGAFESCPGQRRADAALARRNILFGAADFRHDALRDPGKPLNLHAPGQRSLGVMENQGRGGVRCGSGTDLPRRAGDTARFFRKAVMRHMVVGRIASTRLRNRKCGLFTWTDTSPARAFPGNLFGIAAADTFGFFHDLSGFFTEARSHL